ncbi:hypothetical protein VNO80_04667 [Phaseolus coccineus]|uniref:Uncharacterized protein n=1 Tax=Phaseolus coccineus TaxID=3886 RepID=A0AAN9NUM3_PHACN
MAEETDMSKVHQTTDSIMCCKLGIPMQPNAINMCVKSLCSKVDITEGLLKPPVLVHWPDFEICLQPPTSWVKLQLEIYEGAADVLVQAKPYQWVAAVQLRHVSQHTSMALIVDFAKFPDAFSFRCNPRNIDDSESVSLVTITPRN